MANIDFTHKTIENQTAGISVSKTTFQSVFDAIRKIVDKSYRGSTEKLDADLLAGVVPGAGGLAALAKTATIWTSDDTGGQTPAPKQTIWLGQVAAAAYQSFTLPPEAGCWLVVTCNASLTYEAHVIVVARTYGGIDVVKVISDTAPGVSVTVSGNDIRINNTRGELSYMYCSVIRLAW